MVSARPQRLAITRRKFCQHPLKVRNELRVQSVNRAVVMCFLIALEPVYLQIFKTVLGAGKELLGKLNS